MKNQKAFTLIELLIVIAIIGVLAGILFVNINPEGQMDSAADVSTKSSISTIQGAAQMVYDTNSWSYSTVCNNSAATASIYRIVSRVGTECIANNGEYAVEAVMTDGSYFCIDSKGFRGIATGTDRVTASGSNYSCDAS